MKLISLHKGKLYLIVFVVTALVLGLGICNNYRPHVIYASCADIAEKTSNLRAKKEIYKVALDEDFDAVFNECLSEAGYYDGN